MKLVEITIDAGSSDTVVAIGEKHAALDIQSGPMGDDGRQIVRLLIADDQLQTVLDMLQHVTASQHGARIVVLPVEITLPAPAEPDRQQEDAAIATREALYAEVERNIHLDWNFVALVVLSTLVAAIGLIEDSVAVVIGAMVIAPLLGPNLALGLGSALGDAGLMRKALVTMTAGIGLAILLAVAIGLAWSFELDSFELQSRTVAGMDSVVLALASGAAAALSLTTRLSSVLVGVMVAVALLPPAATLGLTLGHGRPDLALGAGLLLAINIVCVNLTCKLVFLVRGIGPRTWLEKERAQRAMLVYLTVWVVSLLVLILAIAARNSLAA